MVFNYSSRDLLTLVVGILFFVGSGMLIANDDNSSLLDAQANDNDSETAGRDNSQDEQPEKDDAEKSSTDKDAKIDGDSPENVGNNTKGNNRDDEDEKLKKEDSKPTMDTTPESIQMDPNELASDFMGVVTAALTQQTQTPDLPIFSSNADNLAALGKFFAAVQTRDHAKLPDETTMQSLILRNPKEWSDIINAFSTRFGPPQFPKRSYESSENLDGNSVAFGVDLASGRLTHRGHTIPLLYVETLSGSQVFFVPPIEINRDERTNAPRVFILDPKTDYDVMHPKTKQVLKPEGFLHAVLTGEIRRDERFHFVIELDVHNDHETMAAIKQAAPQIFAGKAENSAIFSRTAANLRNDDVYPKDIAVFPFSRIEFSCIDPGYDELVFYQTKEHPTLKSIEQISTTAPASFICRLLSSAGAAFEVEFTFRAFRAHKHEARIFEETRAKSDIIAKEIGKGGLSTHDEALVGEKGAINKSDVRILIERDKALENLSQTEFTKRMVLMGVSPVILNSLSKTMHSHYKDMSALTTAQVCDFVNHTLGWTERVSRSSYMDRLNNVVSQKAYNDEGRKLLESMLNADGKSSKFASGLGILIEQVPIGFEVGGGDIHETVDGKFEFSDEFCRKFLDTLSAISKGGKFEVPKDVELVLVSEQDIISHLNQQVTHLAPGSVRTYKLSRSFTSRRNIDGQPKPLNATTPHTIRVDDPVSLNRK